MSRRRKRELRQRREGDEKIAFLIYSFLLPFCTMMTFVSLIDGVDQGSLLRHEGCVTDLRIYSGRRSAYSQYEMSFEDSEGSIFFRPFRAFGLNGQQIRIGDEVIVVQGDTPLGRDTVELWVNGVCRYNLDRYLKHKAFWQPVYTTGLSVCSAWAAIAFAVLWWNGHTFRASLNQCLNDVRSELQEESPSSR